ncbi:MAG: SOS response-associated peptidase [Flavobacteriales bacterium]|nr:MAG: SOS response-associated peptidase [Flavobacteriales bacterium]
MCYTATQVTKAYELQSFYAAGLSPSLTPEYESLFYKADGFTHPSLLILINRDAEKLIELFQWGLMPSWKKPLKDMVKLSNSTLNAKSETARTLPSFRNAIVKQRCIIPVNSFFEYKHVDGDKLPYLIHPVEQPYFNLAGLYSFYKDPYNDEWHKTFTILTQPANTFMADIHNSAKRMPMMLSENLIDDWINPDSPPGLIDDLMQYACDDSSLHAYRVARDLKKLPNEKSILEPIES